MKVYKTKTAALIEHEGVYYSTNTSWDALINRKSLYAALLQDLKSFTKVTDAERIIKESVMAPIDSQEVWAAGVTYYRSMVARAEESKQSGGSTFYDKVYEAERPELFFKSLPHRVAGHNH